MEDERKEKSKFRRIFDDYISYVLIIIVVLLIKRFVVSPIRVNGASMMKTLHNGDIMILDEISYRFHDIKRFDIVVVKTKGDLLIKRVIGLPGEFIEYKDNKLYVNDEEIEDSYGSQKTEDFKVKIPEGYYFVMGDNRTNSLDSRVLGVFSKKEILGKTNLTIFPFNRFGNKE